MSQPIRHPALSAKLEAVRAEKHQSIRHVAQCIDVDYGHINRVFHGQALPSRKILVNMCRVLQCSHQEAIEIFNQTDYRAPELSELLDEEQPVLIAS